VRLPLNAEGHASTPGAPGAAPTPESRPSGRKARSKNGVVIWLTGLSGAGKTTLAQTVATRLRARGRRIEVLDSDVVRAHISTELGFSRADRDRNVARLAFVANLLARNDVAVVVAAISPFRTARAEARALIGDFVEVHLSRPLEDCIKADVKGLYARALVGEIRAFTGVSDPYEEPLDPELRIDTSVVSVDAATNSILARLVELGYADDVRP
jgi:adenylylsulfate kinase